MATQIFLLKSWLESKHSTSLCLGFNVLFMTFVFHSTSLVWCLRQLLFSLFLENQSNNILVLIILQSKNIKQHLSLSINQHIPRALSGISIPTFGAGISIIPLFHRGKGVCDWRNYLLNTSQLIRDGFLTKPLLLQMLLLLLAYSCFQTKFLETQTSKSERGMLSGQRPVQSPFHPTPPIYLLFELEKLCFKIFTVLVFQAKYLKTKQNKSVGSYCAIPDINLPFKIPISP